MFKPSFYNILVPVPERREYLIFNSLYGGYSALKEKEADFVKRISGMSVLPESRSGDEEELIEKLVQGKYLVDEGVDKKRLYQSYCEKRTNTLFHGDEAKIVMTIAPTNSCNMACPYCFEFTKFNGVMSNKTIDQFVPYLESMVKSSPHIKKWSSILVTWYGGEPLLAPDVISKLSKKLMGFAESHGMEFRADAITNGICLGRKNVEILRRNQVRLVQVTIDGPKSVHDISRPLKRKNMPNYETILSNIAELPEEIRLTLRINVDKIVAARIDEFLDDLEANGIWPQKSKQMSLTAAWKRTYREAGENDISSRFNFLEFCAWESEFRNKKLVRYNKWAERKGLPFAKLKWSLPQIQFEDCWTVVSPFTFVVDSQGYVHKCWEDISMKDRRVSHISEPYNPVTFKSPYMVDYNRCSISKKRDDYHNLPCDDCFLLPICGEPSCPQYVKHGRVNCDLAKKQIEYVLKSQYLIWADQPEKISFEKTMQDRACT